MTAEQGDFDGEGVAVADGGAAAMFVPQRAEVPLDHVVGLRAPHPGADVTEQRVAGFDDIRHDAVGTEVVVHHPQQLRVAEVLVGAPAHNRRQLQECGRAARVGTRFAWTRGGTADPVTTRFCSSTR